MPFLAKDEFQEWADDGTHNVWQRVNASGAFIGLCYAAGDLLRNLRVLRGASQMKYRIITDAGNPHIEVAQADSEEEFLDLLTRLNSLTAQDVMVAACSDRKEMLAQLVEKARRKAVAVAGQLQEVLSTEMLQKISSFEIEKASLQQELEETRKALRSKETEKQELQDGFCAVMAQQALGQVADMQNEAKSVSNSTVSSENRPESLGQSGEDNRSHSSPSGAASPNPRPAGPLEISAALTASGIEDGILFPQCLGSSSDMAKMNPVQCRQLDGKSFKESVLKGPFCLSLAKEFWQLAAAPYRGISCNHVDRKEYVELGGKLWEVIARNPAAETLVIGRTCLEIGFRGTVTEDAHGNTSWANWFSNFHAVAAPLKGVNGENLKVLVHKGFQDSYLAVNVAAISWLQKSATDSCCVRIAGHSLGGAMATLFAVDIKQRGWQIDGVVTFGSPRVGRKEFKSLYEKLELDQLTVRFVNHCDPVPWVPPVSWDFEHVVEQHALGLPAVIGNPHSMEGSSKSYYHTLHDAVDGRETQHIAIGIANFIIQHGIASSAVDLIVTRGVASRAMSFMSSESMASLAVQTQQELKVHIALLRQDVAKLAEGMVSAVHELKNGIRQIQQWEWLLDMQTLVQIVKNYKLQKWEQGVPGWFITYQIQQGRILEAAKMELHDGSSPLAPKFVMLYLQAASFLIAAMGISGADQKDVEREFEDFTAEAKGLISKCFHLEIPQLNQILKFLPCSHDFTLPDVHLSLQGRMLQLHGKEMLRFGCQLLDLYNWSGVQELEGLELKLENEEMKSADPMLSRFASSIPQDLKSLRLDLDKCWHTRDESVELFARNIPMNLECLSLSFGFCLKITDAIVQQIASNMPKKLTELSLDFEGCERISEKSVQELARNLPKTLTSLSLNFRKCEQITCTSVQQLARNIPKELLSLRLDFHMCSKITDASLHLLARNMPPNLAFLSLDFGMCTGLTNASVKQVANSLPQHLTSAFLLANQIRLCGPTGQQHSDDFPEL